MMEEEKKALDKAIPPNIQSRQEVIDWVLNNGIASNTALRDLRIIYHYQKERKFLSSQYAVIRTAMEFECDPCTVYRAKQRRGKFIKDK